jgi:peptidylprolyl isomerase
MTQAQQGDSVKVHYTGTLEDGTVFDSSTDREPLQFTIGDGRLIPDFENSVLDMKQGDSKTFTVASTDAYGPYRDEMVVTLQRHQLPENLEVQIGQQLQLIRENGTPVIVQVINASESTVTLDANHPLAGQDLTFEVEMVKIVRLTS